MAVRVQEFRDLTRGWILSDQEDGEAITICDCCELPDGIELTETWLVNYEPDESCAVCGYEQPDGDQEDEEGED